MLLLGREGATAATRLAGSRRLCFGRKDVAATALGGRAPLPVCEAATALGGRKDVAATAAGSCEMRVGRARLCEREEWGRVTSRGGGWGSAKEP